MRRRCERAIRCRITSVSEVDWQMAPEEMRSRLSVSALVRLPLWASAKPPVSRSANSGCTLRRAVAPVGGGGGAAGVEIGKQRLHVAQDRVAGGGVAVVAERDVALEPADHLGLVEV